MSLLEASVGLVFQTRHAQDRSQGSTQAVQILVAELSYCMSCEVSFMPLVFAILPDLTAPVDLCTVQEVVFKSCKSDNVVRYRIVDVREPPSKPIRFWVNGPLKNGELWVFDPSSSQYGCPNSVCPREKIGCHRAKVIIALDRSSRVFL